MRRNALIILVLWLPVFISAQEAPDTSKHRIIRLWTLSGDYSEEVAVSIDTSFSLAHQHKKADKYSPFNAYLGNYGLPLYQMNFFDRPTDPDKFLYWYYYPFMKHPGNPVFVNTQVPFTEMGYSHAGNRDRAEQTFLIRHSQNVNRYFNFGLLLDVVYSLGYYSYQRSDDKNFTYFSSYTGEKYKLYLSGGVNNVTSYENGGIVDKEQLSQFDTRDVQVKLGNLNQAISTIKNRNLLIVQRYTVGKTPAAGSDSVAKNTGKKGLRLNGTFSHIFLWDKTRRSYIDNYPLSGFYDTSAINYNRSQTFDSLSMRALKNTIRFDFNTDESRKVSLGIGFGIRNELFRYTQETRLPANPAYDTILVPSLKNSNNILVGRVFNNIGDKFRWVATGELYFTGYRSGDIEIDGLITKEFVLNKGKVRWDITGSMRNTTPSFWMHSYNSNHFRWSDDLQKEFRIDAGTKINYPDYRLSARFNYAIIDNFTYFGQDALPAQHSGGLSVLSLLVKKEFSAWKFHLANDVLVQKSSNSDIVDLPLVCIRSAAYFEHNFHFELTNGDLNTQTGIEAVYNTSYKGLSYMPATGVYYQVQNGQVGNYPYINAFINIKIKRTRIYLMMEHINHGFTGYDYFLVPSYPMIIRMFKYGFSWTFYD
jgi:hypothetical protein